MSLSNSTCLCTQNNFKKSTLKERKIALQSQMNDTKWTWQSVTNISSHPQKTTCFQLPPNSKQIHRTYWKLILRTQIYKNISCKEIKPNSRCNLSCSTSNKHISFFCFFKACKKLCYLIWDLCFDRLVSNIKVT